MLDTTACRPATDTAPLLLSVFAGFGVGGQQVRFTTVANRLGRAWRHAIVAMNGDLSCRERLDSALDVSFPAIGTGKGDPLGLYRRLRATLRTLRPQVLLTHNWGTIDWALANRLPRPLVAHLHAEDGFGPEEAHGQLPRRVWARRFALRRSALMLPSLTLRRLAEHTWRLPPANLHYVPNGVDLHRFIQTGPAEARPPGWGLIPGGVVIGTVAALRPEKNLARLVRAVAQVSARIGPDTVRLLVVGDGPERAGLELLAARLLPPGHAAFTGHLADPSASYRHMDVFALSSDTEQMPLSLLEAMASGLPVAATAVGDVSAMLAASNQPYAVSCDETALGAALAQMAADAALRLRLGTDNRARAAAQYGQDRMVERWGELLASGPAYLGQLGTGTGVCNSDIL